tara:strand:- start:296 stop:493 length:198 start_codon:yes stop_codon:yes gene_type:complete
MSAEQLKTNNLEIDKTDIDKIPTKVDINFLISRAREEKKKENKANYIFFIIASFLILSIGIVLSL